jgi:hypothetical protein
MSTEPPPPPPLLPLKLDFAPLHRSAELEDIHAEVTQNDLQHQQSRSTRKVLVKYLTVIGDGSDIDNSQLSTQ